MCRKLTGILIAIRMPRDALLCCCRACCAFLEVLMGLLVHWLASTLTQRWLHLLCASITPSHSGQFIPVT